MKIIDLLNKIANGEEVPKKLYYEELLWEWYGETYNDGKQCLFEDYIDKRYVITDILNDTVEIIEEEKEIKKLEIEQDNPSSNYYIRNEHGTKCGLTKHSKMIAEKVNELIDEIKKLKEQIK